jgi:hypothetical protein
MARGRRNAADVSRPGSIEAEGATAQIEDPLPLGQLFAEIFGHLTFDVFALANEFHDTGLAQDADVLEQSYWETSRRSTR